MGRVVHGASCPWGELSLGRVVHGASCLWGELSMGRVVVGRVLMGRVVRGASYLGASGPGTGEEPLVIKLYCENFVQGSTDIKRMYFVDMFVTQRINA
jgi:hypothetical protein